MFGFVAGRPDILMPKLTPAQRERHLQIARSQQAPFRRNRRGTDRYYQDIIDSARQRGSYRRPTYGETYGQRIVDRLNGRRSSGSGNFGFRRGGPQTTGAWNDGRGPTVFQPQRSSVIPGEWDHIRGRNRRQQPRRNPNIPRGTETWGDWGQSKEQTARQRERYGRRSGKWDGWFRDPYIPSKRRRSTRGSQVREDDPGRYSRHGGGRWDKDPIPTRGRKRRRGKSASKPTSGKKGVHRTRDKSLPIWQRYGAKSEAEWKGMSRKERGLEKARQDWERRKAFLRANPNKFRGGISMQANYRNGKFTGGFAGNKLNKKDRLEQWIRHKDQQYKRKWRK